MKINLELSFSELEIKALKTINWNLKEPIVSNELAQSVSNLINKGIIIEFNDTDYGNSGIYLSDLGKEVLNILNNPYLKPRRKHHSYYFNLYKLAKFRLEKIIKLRRSDIQILIGNDEYAKMFRSFRMRLEIIESYLQGQTPNWAFASSYLTDDEIERRNKLYE